MQLRLDKPWRRLDAEEVAEVPAQLGVYQLGTEDGQVVYSGFAGGHTRFGLRGELERARRGPSPPPRFRYEVTMQYWSRHKELLMLHVAEHGDLPRDNEPEPLGRLHGHGGPSPGAGS